MTATTHSTNALLHAVLALHSVSIWHSLKTAVLSTTDRQNNHTESSCSSKDIVEYAAACALNCVMLSKAPDIQHHICDTTDIAKRVKQTVISYCDTSCHVQTAAYDSDLVLQCSIYNMHCMQLPQHTRREDNWSCLMCDILWVGQLIF